MAVVSQVRAVSFLPIAASKTLPSVISGNCQYEYLPVFVSRKNHILDLCFTQVFAKAFQDTNQLIAVDETVAILVIGLESFLHLFSTVSVFHLASHQCQKLGKVDCAVASCIHFIYHSLNLGLGRVLAQRTHGCAKIFGRDCAITILIEQRESLYCSVVDHADRMHDRDGYELIS